MAKLIKEVRRPHDCRGELKAEFGHLDLWPGSIADCSCGKRFTLKDSQRDGPYWFETGKVVGT